jgi:hypothetical protein
MSDPYGGECQEGLFGHRDSYGSNPDEYGRYLNGQPARGLNSPLAWFAFLEPEAVELVSFLFLKAFGAATFAS